MNPPIVPSSAQLAAESGADKVLKLRLVWKPSPRGDAHWRLSAGCISIGDVFQYEGKWRVSTNGFLPRDGTEYATLAAAKAALEAAAMELGEQYHE